MKMQYCKSCGVPLTDESVSVNRNYCNHCTDSHGNLLPREAVQAGIAQWLRMVDPEISEEVSFKRAEYYLKSMPAWAL